MNFTMNASVLLGHSYECGFNKAIAETAVKTLKKNHHHVS